jgi:YaaC-like Protein
MLRRFQNVEILTKALIDIHSAPTKQHHNVKKQAEQIRFCLLQAGEYQKAAEQVGLGTKPVLLYYSVLSLALAQILLKGDGMVSLEKARGANAHHGLTFHRVDLPSQETSFKCLADAIWAKPMSVENVRKGTFELWHKYSREYPMVGMIEEIFVQGYKTSTSSVLFGEDDNRSRLIDESGLTFLDVITGLPHMLEWLNMNGIASNCIRAKITRRVENEEHETSIMFHPSRKNTLDELLDKFLIHPNSYELISVKELNNGLQFSAKGNKEKHPDFILPPGVSFTTNEIRFLSPKIPLNEFGLYYFGLFVLSNYSRYFPEVWMKDVESDSTLAHAVSTFLEFATWQIALLTASELGRHYFVQSG